jgi:phospholipid transport system substrate-binding protein
MPSRRALLAAALSVASGAAMAQAGGPAQPIRALDDALLAIMHAGKTTSFATRADMLRPAITGAFDLTQVLRTSVGPRWAAFTPRQQADLLDVFTRYTLASYVANFNSFGGEQFQILPEQRQVGDDQVVQTRIVTHSGDATRIDYVMRFGESGWKAIDVLLDGSISRVAVQRSDFRALLAGGDPTRLIASLRAKTAVLEAGGKP